MSRGATNLVITVATLLLLCICFLYRDTIPAGNGAGYDGEGYVAWVKTLSIDSLIASASMVMSISFPTTMPPRSMVSCQLTPKS